MSPADRLLLFIVVAIAGLTAVAWRLIRSWESVMVARAMRDTDVMTARANNGLDPEGWPIERPGPAAGGQRGDEPGDETWGRQVISGEGEPY